MSQFRALRKVYADFSRVFLPDTNENTCKSHLSISPRGKGALDASRE